MGVIGVPPTAGGGVKVAARTLLAKPRLPGTEGPWATLVARFPPKDHNAGSTARGPRRLQCSRALLK